MAQLAGTITKQVTLPQTPQISLSSGVAISNDDTTAYFPDRSAGNQVLRCTLSGAYPVTSWATGITSARDCCLTADGSILYVLQDNGAVLSIPTATGVVTQIGTANGIVASQWMHMALSADGAYLYLTNDSTRNIYRYTLSDNTVAQWLWMTWYPSGLFVKPNGNILCFNSNGGPTSTGPIVEVNLTTEQYTVVALTTTNANTDGEALKVASTSASGDLLYDPTGTYLYFISSTNLKVLAGGNVSAVPNGASLGTNTFNRMAYYHLSDRLIVAGGNNVTVVS